jgi:NADPH-dependent 2,4-dienoyl-CoA reductase/sulfur reductase-like enzyme
MTTVVVGASVAGVATVRSLRRRGFDREIVLLEAESRMPYDKPPVSKQMLTNALDGAEVPLLATQDVAELRVDLRLATRAVGVDLPQGVVVTDTDERVKFDQLVIATGSRARTHPAQASLKGIHTLRTADDAAAVRAGLARAESVVAVGGGFIGLELASIAHTFGCNVTIVEMQDRILLSTLGPRAAEGVEALHRGHGVELITGVAVRSFEGTDRLTAVELSDGRRVKADLAIVGMGAEPVVDWLVDAGLGGAHGVDCDADMRVIGAENCWAVGDVARWPHPYFDDPVRVEHWTSANETAEIAAASMTGSQRPNGQPPYVWSDQFGRKLQLVGRPGMARRCLIRDGGQERLAAAYLDGEGITVGGFTIDDPRLFMELRRAVKVRTAGSDLTALGLVEDVSWEAQPPRLPTPTTTRSTSGTD